MFPYTLGQEAYILVVGTILALAYGGSLIFKGLRRGEIGKVIELTLFLLFAAWLIGGTLWLSYKIANNL